MSSEGIVAVVMLGVVAGFSFGAFIATAIAMSSRIEDKDREITRLLGEIADLKKERTPSSSAFMTDRREE